MIKVLDSFVSDKIAAGEVIERPLSIIKELVENSIDAGADNIIVEIRNGGKSYIRVTDNGCGIPPEELEIAFERHATGKISRLSDLDRIETLGFRGEALASIAAVSRVTIYSKTEGNASGAKLVMHGGKKVSLSEAGANRGTTIIVEDVFYNTPARRKFMKSDAAEASVIISLVQKLAICYAGISFRLINNGSTVLTTEGDGSCRHAISAVFPAPEYRDLLEVSGCGVSGFVSDPGTTRNNRKGQIFFVNGRIVSSDTIEKGLLDGYGDRIFSGHPIGILFIEVDPETIDVNIHPNKREIKFLEKDKVRRDVRDAVAAVMGDERAIPSAVRKADPSPADTAEHSEKTGPAAQLGIREMLRLREHAVTDYEKNNSATPEHHDDNTNFAGSDDIIGDGEGKRKDTEAAVCGTAQRIELAAPKGRPFDFGELVVKGYVFNAYIITQAGDSLYVLDQHAAHERIMYERLIEKYNSEEHPSQPVLSAYFIEVPADIYNGERSFLAELGRMGYDIEDFGMNSFIVRGIPVYMSADEAVSFARDYIEGSRLAEGRNTAVIDKLIMRSCKAAVKANNELSEIEIRELLETLSECVNPFSCPHGRPTFVRITRYEIERSFKRK